MERRGPWRIVRRRLKYLNSRVRLEEHELLSENNTPATFVYVKVLAGVCVLPVDNDGNAYLTREFHYALGEKDIEGVSGGREKGEIAEDTARRELAEELGITAREWIDLGVIHPFTANIYCPQRLFLARHLEFGEPKFDENERIELVKMSFDEMLAQAIDGTIFHGATLAVIFRAAIYLKKLLPA